MIIVVVLGMCALRGSGSRVSFGFIGVIECLRVFAAVECGFLLIFLYVFCYYFELNWVGWFRLFCCLRVWVRR